MIDKRSSRHLPSPIPTPRILGKKLDIAPPTQLHKRLRPSLTRRRTFLALTIRKPILALCILLKDFYGHVIILVLDDFTNLDIIDTTEKRAFARDFALREIELVHGAREAVGAVGGVGDPGMLEAFVDGDALLDVDGQHAVDEVEGRVADGVPVGGGVVEAAGFDLLRERVGVVGGVELV